MRKIFLIIALAIASFTFAEEAQTDSIQTTQTDSIQTVETETIEYIEQTTDSIETSIFNIKDYGKSIKVIQNGIVIIYTDGHRYTVTGALID